MQKFFSILLLIAIFSSCASIEKMAMNMIADTLTGEGSTTVFTGDPDPKLVGDALPFAIKLYETLLDGNPDHQGLMLTTGSLFVMYANAFIQGPAEMLPSSAWQEREEAMNRAKQMYLRGYNILTSALEKKYPGFNDVSENELSSILIKFKKDDVPLIYWTVAGGMSAFALDIMDFELSPNVPKWIAMVDRAYELNPDFDVAALDELLVILYASLPEIMGGDIEKAKLHFNRAVEKTGGNSAGVFVSYAQSISIPAQDYDSFKEFLDRAIAIDVNANPSTRLVNIINQEKAKWLLDNAYINFSFLPIPDDIW